MLMKHEPLDVREDKTAVGSTRQIGRTSDKWRIVQVAKFAAGV